MKRIEPKELVSLLNDLRTEKIDRARFTGVVYGFRGEHMSTRFLQLKGTYDLFANQTDEQNETIYFSNEDTSLEFTKKGAARWSDGWHQNAYGIYIPIDLAPKAGLRIEAENIWY